LKKQHKTFFLLFAVLVIWGLIGYQVYKRLNPTKPLLETTSFSSSFTPEKKVENSFYELKGNYRDPFLGKFAKKKKKIVKKRIVKPKPIVRFPNIIYNGIIEGNQSISYILTMNNQQHILKLGDTIEQIKLLRANSKEAVVVFQGNKKTILLQ
jgi:hypothetical protein